MSLSWLLLASLGWRGDGSGVVSEARPPARWSLTENVRWSTPLPAWGNASPVAFGDLICTVSEPTTVTCHAAADGRLRWSATNDHADTLDPAARATHEARRATILALDAQLGRDQAEFSRLQREVRRGAAEAAPALSDLSSRIQAARAEIATFDRYRTDRPRSIMGWSTETPVSDGASLWVLTGNGVLSRFDRTGKRAWARQLPDTPAEMRGFSTGTSASPLLVDGTLITAWGHLRGHDPATGSVRWTGPAWRDYGTPAALRVGSLAYVAAPDGAVLRAHDGRLVARGLGDQWFVGPHAAGDRVWYAGGRSQDDNATAGGITVQAWSLAPSGEHGLQPTRRWATKLTAPGAWFTAPVAHDGLLFLTSDRGQVVVLSDTDGQVRWTADLAPDLGGATVYPSPTIAGGRLFVIADNGRAVILDAGARHQVVGRGELEPTRATPLFVGDRVYLRGETRLWCVGY